MVEFTAVEQTKEKTMKRNEDRLRDLWENIKHNNIHTLGVPEGAKREKGPEKIFEGMENDIPCKWKSKENWSNNTHIR